MADVVGLPKRRYPLTQEQEMLCEQIRDKIAVSLLYVENEVVPLLRKIVTSLDCAVDYAGTGALVDGLPGNALGSVESAVDLARRIESLIECYEHILVPAPHDGET